MAKSKMNLKQAREQNKLDKFIKEHEKEEKGDDNRLFNTVISMSGKTLLKVPATSCQDGSDD